MTDFAVNGGFLACLWLVLLQVAIVYLQRPDLYRRLGDASGLPDFYAVATGFIGTALNWGSWLLSAFVAKQFGIVSGVLFFCLGMGASLIANFAIPRLARADRIAHLISIPVTVLLVRALLLETGVGTGI